MRPAAPVVEAADLFRHLDMAWPPMAHVRRGAERLGPEGVARVSQRLDEALASFTLPSRAREGTDMHATRAALRRFFSFLSQVEVIAIEVPLSALPTASDEMRPLLENQLADEVFHAALFAALARRVGGLDRPIPEAERLLDQIRSQEDAKTTAILLNLLAEGWIENLFDHAATWGVADDVFNIVLEDESRHVEEAMAHAEGVDVAHVETAVRAFEDELFRIAQHPRVMLPILTLAGESKFRALTASFLEVHKKALGEIGLAPATAVQEMARTLEELAIPGEDAPAPPTRVEPESQWRRTALELWDSPRNPVMHGWLDVRVDHVPREDLTPLLVAAVGRVWADYPRINRFTVGGVLYRPSSVNVGVRVAVGDKGEALSTIVVPDADKRSLADIRRILRAGVKRMNSLGGAAEGIRPDADSESLSSVLRDEELMGMIPAETVTCPVTVSNVGRAGLSAGVGAMPGALGQSVEIIAGRVEKKPVWHGWRYKPTDSLTLGCSADHRLIDGPHAAEAINRLERALSAEGVAEIRARPDTIPADADLGARALENIGISHERGVLLLSCKLPWWLGWMCWLFKK